MVMCYKCAFRPPVGTFKHRYGKCSRCASRVRFAVQHWRLAFTRNLVPGRDSLVHYLGRPPIVLRVVHGRCNRGSTRARRSTEAP